MLNHRVGRVVAETGRGKPHKTLHHRYNKYYEEDVTTLKDATMTHEASTRKYHRVFSRLRGYKTCMGVEDGKTKAHYFLEQ
jgi:hypothetical protein